MPMMKKKRKRENAGVVDAETVAVRRDGVDQGFSHRKGDESVAAQVEGEGVGRCQSDAAEVGADDPRVLDVRCREHSKAAV
jgi:hypothetical protein